MKFKNFEVLRLQSQDIKPYLETLGSLRIQVFKEWPYIYEGNLDYEKKYLQRYVQAQNSFVAICFDGSKAIGATTAIDLLEEDESFQEPFLKKNYNLDDIVYFGESILLKEYRGHGIGQLFMNLRLEFANQLPNKKFASFCAVVRPSTHSLKPAEYRPLDEFWAKNGFAKAPGMLASYSWQDLDQKTETKKQLQFWIKNLK